MSNFEYLIVHKSILPKELEQVIEVRELLEKNTISVSDACKAKGISRSTYYKYKDYVFRPQKNQGAKASFGIKVKDEKGILSLILASSYKQGASVISINQESPINKMAYITLILDISEINGTLNELKENLKKIDGIENIEIIGVE